MTVDLLARAGMVSRAQRPLREHLGPRVEVMTERSAPPSAPGLLRGVIGPGQFVPMHSHDDPETFYVLDGALEGLTFDVHGRPVWQSAEQGDAWHVPPNARHALRNATAEPVTTLIITSLHLLRFFEDTGRPIDAWNQPLAPPTPEVVTAFVAEAERHGHWLASPEENAAVGIALPPPA